MMFRKLAELRGRSAEKRAACAPILSLMLAALMLPAGQVRGADDTKPATQKEKELIAVLQSNASAAEKAITCKRLAIYGSEEAVPALAPLLADESLASWARIALEAIPGPAADQALRDALAQLHGRLLVGVINSIGVRRDAKATSPLAAKLKDNDPEVVSAAAVALGRIGGPKAAKALKSSLAKSPTAARSGVAEGAVRCAEQFLTAGKYGDAMKLYDAVRHADVPKQKVLEAIRGAILARQSSGIPLLVEQLRSSDKALFGIGLHTARELPGPKATEALIGEFQRAGADRQPVLLLALADRGDAAAMPTIVDAAKTGSKPVRLVAIGVLERSGNVSSMPVLLASAEDPDPEVAQAALAALVRLPGAEVDGNILSGLPQAQGKSRQVLIELAGRRGIEAALPAIVGYVQDLDKQVRVAAVQAIGIMGGEKQVAELVKVLEKTQDPGERGDVETALLGISGRRGSSCVPPLSALAQNSDKGLRIIALHALAAAGGPEALAAVKAATDDQDETVQDEAVRTLSSWPNTWPEDGGIAEPLLSLAKSGKKTTHQVLAMRGYLQFLQGDKKLPPDEKITRLKEALPLIQRPEEKRSAIAVIRDAPTSSALEILVGYAAETSIADDACSAILSLAKKDLPGVPKEDRQKALQAVVEKSSDDSLKKKAEDALKAI
jgi:HEAT repeat protein